MIFLRTGLPGGGKTLNSIKEIVEDKKYSTKQKFYTNLKLFMLDIDVCNSFSGWFYGVFYENLNDKHKKRYDKIIKLVHDDDRYVDVDDVPWLSAYFVNFTEFDALNLFLHWVRKLYPRDQLTALNNLFELNDNPTTEQVKTLNYHFNYFVDATKWNELPAGSLIFIDECQHFFPPKGTGSKRPEHYEKFQTHRHKGYDIHLVTQDPLFIDSHVRNLAGRHVHFYRPFVSKYIVRYQHDEIFQIRNNDDKAKCRRSTIKRDTSFYGVYWSSDEHTHTAQVPKVLFLIPVFFIIFAALVYWMVTGGIVNLFNHSDTKSNTSTTTQIVNSSANSSPVVSFRIDYVLSGFEKFDHPLKKLCLNYSYSGNNTIKSGRFFIVEHFINCLTNQTTTIIDTKEDGSQVETSIPLVRTLSSDYLKNLGYSVSLNNRTPVIIYKNHKIIMNNF